MSLDGLRAARLGLGAAVLAVAAACYTGGGGTDPPTSTFYFPVGLAVSQGGNVLYAVNSDFDLQWNGGTLQAYDLHRIRRDVVVLENAALNGLPFPLTASNALSPAPGQITSSPVEPSTLVWPGSDGGNAAVEFCFQSPPEPTNNGTSIGLQPGTNCAPPIDSTAYQTDSSIIGAFATDLQLSTDGSRLFAPVRGSATVTWADVVPDQLTAVPQPEPQPGGTPSPPFQIFCGQPASGSPRCASINQTGDDPNSPANTRAVTMPGEPYGLAQSQDGTVMVVTSQTNTQASLLTTGIAPNGSPASNENNQLAFTGPTGTNFLPTMQFVANNLDSGGNGIVAIPHDPNVVLDPSVPGNACPDPGGGKVCARPAFLMTSRNTADLDLLRYYNDDGSSLSRPYIQLENKFPLTAESGGGIDSRGIAIDNTQRINCQVNGLADPVMCGKIPARLFFANRSSAVLAYGTVGDPSLSGDGNYNPDLVAFTGNTPVNNGPSRVYIAPIVDSFGNYAVRVFVLCYDANQLYIFDPDYIDNPENIVTVGVGPSAMAFDPFDLTAVAAQSAVPVDTRYPSSQLPAGVTLNTYRFAYLASFTQSYVQIIDLDMRNPQTFEHVVYTLGQPTPPKGQ